MVIKKKRESKDDVDINIKIGNLERAIKSGMKCQKKDKLSGGCWVFGSALAIVLSYTQNSSIFWAIIHGILSWLYVIYRVIVLMGWL